MKLFLVHTGFTDDIHGGVYEYHSNFFIVAKDASDAKAKVNLKSEFIQKKMHIDSIQELDMIDGYKVNMEAGTEGSKNTTVIMKYTGQKLRDLL